MFKSSTTMAIALMSLLAASSQAVIIRHNSVELARTDFDDLVVGDAEGQSPAGFFGFADTGGSVRELQISSETSAPGLAPALSPNNYAHCDGSTGGCKTGLIFASSPITSGVIEVEWWLKKSTGTDVLGFSLAGDLDISGPSKRAQLEIGFTGLGMGADEVDVRTPGVSSANLNITLDAWNKFLLRYDFVDDNTSGDRTNDVWTLFVNDVEQTSDGTTPHALTNLNSGSGVIGIDRFGFEGTSNSTNWAVDLVPEPASFLLLLVGSCGLAIFRRRR